MGEVSFVAFDNFIAIWMKNDKEGISLARQLGVDSLRPDKDPGEE